MSEKIQLKLAIKDGLKIVVDQHGRELDGVLRLSSESNTGEIDVLEIAVYQLSDGDPIVSGQEK